MDYIYVWFFKIVTMYWARLYAKQPKTHEAGTTISTLQWEDREAQRVRMGRCATGTQVPLFPELTGSHYPLGWRADMVAEAQNPSEDKHKTPSLNAPESVSRLETDLSQFVSFWDKASCCFPGDMSGPQLWHWLLRTALLGGSRELFAIFQTPWKKGSCSQPRTCPWEIWLCFLAITVTLATSKFSGYCSQRWIWGQFTSLLREKEREKLSSHNPGLVCVRAEHRFLPLLSGEEKADVNHHPWEFTLLCCKILHY